MYSILYCSSRCTGKNSKCSTIVINKHVLFVQHVDTFFLRYCAVIACNATNYQWSTLQGTVDLLYYDIIICSVVYLVGSLLPSPRLSKNVDKYEHEWSTWGIPYGQKRQELKALLSLNVLYSSTLYYVPYSKQTLKSSKFLVSYVGRIQNTVLLHAVFYSE